MTYITLSLLNNQLRQQNKPFFDILAEVHK